MQPSRVTPNEPPDMEEIWKTIPSCDGYYEASSLGSIRRSGKPLPSGRTHKLRVLKPGYDTAGYRNVVLSINRLVRTVKIARLVCEAFHGPAPLGMVVAHGNGSRSDDRAENLRWATRQENEEDKRRHGTVSTGMRNGAYTKPERRPRGAAHGGSVVSVPLVPAVRRLCATGMRKVHVARLLGVSRDTVERITNNKHWSSKTT